MQNSMSERPQIVDVEEKIPVAGTFETMLDNMVNELDRTIRDAATASKICIHCNKIGMAAEYINLGMNRFRCRDCNTYVPINELT